MNTEQIEDKQTVKRLESHLIAIVVLASCSSLFLLRRFYTIIITLFSIIHEEWRTRREKEREKGVSSLLVADTKYNNKTEHKNTRQDSIYHFPWLPFYNKTKLLLLLLLLFLQIPNCVKQIGMTQNKLNSFVL